MHPLPTLALLFTLTAVCHGANILALFPIHGISNYNVADSLLRALASRGHNVTVVTSFPTTSSISNFHQIDVSSSKGLATNSIDFQRLMKIIRDVRTNFANMERLSKMYCRVMFTNPNVQSLRAEKFDLVINTIFGCDCDAGFAWTNSAPLISILNARHTPWSSVRVANPFNPSFMRVIHSRFPAHMSFRQRVINTLWYLYFLIKFDYWHNGAAADYMSKRFFGKESPNINTLVYNTSLVMVNTHYSIDEAYPLVPNLIEVAGLHIKPPKALPHDIKKFMDGAEHGVIYFTLGSMVRTSSFPKKIVQAFKDAFAEIPQRVLWKYEIPMQDTPANVMTSPWLPQNDIFNHPNIKAFISHGGNSGSIEAVHYGIPLIGIPLFYDQYRNILSFVEKGVAVMLDVDDISKEKILSAIHAVTRNGKYSERMKALSKLFQDRPMPVLDTAVYWTEYVIRHRGAPQLRIGGSGLHWYQYLLLDVTLFILFAAIVVCWCGYKIFRSAYHAISITFSSSQKPMHKKL